MTWWGRRRLRPWVQRGVPGEPESEPGPGRAVATAFVLLVVGLMATALYMPTTPPADELAEIAIFDLWTGLLAAMVGFALASR